jgi:hypothetical protein
VGKAAVPIPSDEYFQWILEDSDHGSRTVRVDVLRSGDELVRVSTTFLMGINHRWVRDSDPLLFETMVFGGTMDQAQWRYSTWEQAEVGHQGVLEQLLREMPNLTMVVDEPRPPCLTRYERIIRDLCQSLKS